MNLFYVESAKLPIITVMVIICFSIGFLNVQAQQRREFSKEEKAQITKASQCSGNCSDPMKDIISASARGADEVGAQVVDHYYEKGLAWVSKSALVGTIGGIAVGLLQPSDLAGAEFDMWEMPNVPKVFVQQYTPPPYNPPPLRTGGGMTVTRICRNASNQEITCPPN